MQTILEILARNAVAATLLAGAVLLATAVIRRPAIRNALWLIVLIRFVMPPILSVPVFDRAENSVETPKRIAEVSTIAIPVSSLPDVQPTLDVELIPFPRVVSAEPAPSPLPPRLPSTAPAEAFAPQAFATGAPAEVTPEAELSRVELLPAVAELARVQHTPATAEPPFWLIPAIFAVWMIGALLVIGLAIVRIARFQLALCHAVAADQDIHARTNEIARRLGLSRFPIVWLVPGRVPPMLWMLVPHRAKLILPASLFAKLETGQLDAILAHELAHLRRGDPWIRWLELFTVACYWWHPLLPLIRRRLRASEEECCDAAVVSCLDERKAYATALVETLEFLDGPASPATPVLASGAGPVHDLQRRLTMIMNGSTRNRLTRFGALAVLGVAVGALAVGPAFTNAQPDEKKGRDFGPKGEGGFKDGKDRPFDRGGEGGFKDGKDRPFDKGGDRGDRDRPFQPKGDFKDGKDKDRPFPPKDFDRDRPRAKDGPGGDELERAKHDLERARDEAQRAIERVQDAERRLEKLARERQQNGPKGPPSGLGGNPGGAPFNPGTERQLQDMQKQIEQMKVMIDELRRELQRGNNPRPEPKGPPGFRLPGPGENPLPKRPLERKSPDKDN